MRKETAFWMCVFWLLISAWKPIETSIPGLCHGQLQTKWPMFVILKMAVEELTWMAATRVVEGWVLSPCSCRTRKLHTELAHIQKTGIHSLLKWTHSTLFVAFLLSHFFSRTSACVEAPTPEGESSSLKDISTQAQFAFAWIQGRVPVLAGYTILPGSVVSEDENEASGCWC